MDLSAPGKPSNVKALALIAIELLRDVGSMEEEEEEELLSCFGDGVEHDEDEDEDDDGFRNPYTPSTTEIYRWWDCYRDLGGVDGLSCFERKVRMFLSRRHYDALLDWFDAEGVTKMEAMHYAVSVKPPKNQN